jgi:hypothetical protein
MKKNKLTLTVLAAVTAVALLCSTFETKAGEVLATGCTYTWNPATTCSWGGWTITTCTNGVVEGYPQNCAINPPTTPTIQE